MYFKTAGCGNINEFVQCFDLDKYFLSLVFKTIKLNQLQFGELPTFTSDDSLAGRHIKFATTSSRLSCGAQAAFDSINDFRALLLGYSPYCGISLAFFESGFVLLGEFPWSCLVHTVTAVKRYQKLRGTIKLVALPLLMFACSIWEQNLVELSIRIKVNDIRYLPEINPMPIVITSLLSNIDGSLVTGCCSRVECTRSQQNLHNFEAFGWLLVSCCVPEIS